MAHVISLSAALVCFEEGTLVVSSGAVGLPATVFSGATGGYLEVLLSIEADQIRMALAGGAAGATSMAYDVGDKITVAGIGNCRNLSMIRVTNDATVRYQAFRRPI